MDITYNDNAMRFSDLYNEQEAQEENRRNLAVGVKGLKCVYVGLSIEYKLFSDEQKQALNTILGRLCHDEYVSSVEIYENGSINVYGRQKGKSTWFGFWAVRV